ncbi:hypothetical protein I302_108575 [Kwoniella bestiolae CBS 10118]|uniref:Uncharacterized protein n=1 Tax=Kwoniella bestiolae CBS 10118 TaxID=1296100 RepID=A0A1B9FR13_9TREE|nr:hypothetical protein I302_09269 [Kwoniella bestiolae CBS 10118]OCF21182.1 hypothetical protein I302_09269 [Kwoniella bestiolae CBS 10118]
MPELFEIKAFAALLKASLTDTPQHFTIVTYPKHCGKDAIINKADAEAAMGTPIQVALTKSDISSYGKELVIRISPTRVLICHFALHGHAVTLSPQQLKMADVCREAGLPPFTPLIFRALGDHNSIAVIDRNKLCRLAFVQLKDGELFETCRTQGRGPCPVKESEPFEQLVRSIPSRGYIKRNFSPIAHYIYSKIYSMGSVVV